MAIPTPARPRLPAVALAFLIMLPGLAGAQAPPGTAGGAPLRDEPGDWWGDVHRWTGSDATRPSRSARVPAAPPAASPDGAGRVTTSATSRSNIRREPSTGAPVQRVLRPGTTLRVFDEAPGGWLQVGEGDQPIGWIHRSTLQAP